MAGEWYFRSDGVLSTVFLGGGGGEYGSNHKFIYDL